MKLLGNRVLVEPLPQTTVSAGGIIYSPNHRDDQKQFTVLAVGPGRISRKGILIAPEVVPGDKVIAELFTDHLIMPNGSRVIDASSIIAKW